MRDIDATRDSRGERQHRAVMFLRRLFRRNGRLRLPLIAGVDVRDWPTVVKMRLTECRRHGHLFPYREDYCQNCAAPWFFTSAAKWRKERWG